MDVVIVGAGVMGCAAALVLAERGARVIVLERGSPGDEASTAAAGILGAQTELHDAEAREKREGLLPLFVRARREYAAWAEALRQTTGVDIGHRVCGLLSLARSEEEHAELAKAAAWHKERGLTADLLDAKGARALEPELTADIVSALHFPEEAQVDPKRLMRALVRAMARPGIEVRTGVTVQHILIERDACVGVMANGSPLRAEATVLAAGSWSTTIPGVPTEVAAVRPVRGQIVELAEQPPRLRTMVLGAGAYAVPRGDGRVVCGSTREHVGYEKGVTAGGVHQILSKVLVSVPSLAGAALTSTWSGLRPHVESEVPLVGRSPLERLFLATGHYRNGILLAKVTADAVADAVLG